MEYAEDGLFENIRITDVTNWTFKVQKKRVGYLTPGPDDEPLTYPTAVWLGDNLTGVFKTGSVCFSAELFPDYAKNVSTEITSDNSFVLQFSGRATSKIVHGCRVMSRMKGSVTGTQGCGCMDFGHKSPTRADSVFGVDCDHVIDKAGVDGVWTATLKSK